MEAQIPSASLKPLYRALQCLSRIGGEITLEAHADRLLLTNTSASHSAHATITLHQRFFSAYTPPASTLYCRLQARLLMGIFKPRKPNPASTTSGSSTSGNNFNAGGGAGSVTPHTVVRCLLRIEQSEAGGPGSTGECRLVVRMEFREGICRTHRLFYEACSGLVMDYSHEDCKNRWRVGAKAAATWIGHFARGLDEVSMRMTPTSVLVRSWAEDHYASAAIGPMAAGIPDFARSLHTELSIDPDDFDQYVVGGPVELTMGMREFRAILMYAEAVALPLEAFFNHGGSPIFFRIGAQGQRAAPDMVADFIVATVGDILTTVSSAYVTPQRQQQQQRGMSPQFGTFTTQQQHQQQRHVEQRVSQLSVHDTATPLRAIMAHHTEETPASHKSSFHHDRISDSGSGSGSRLWPPPSAADSLLRTPTNASGEERTPSGVVATTGREYRLLDMPRPLVPPGVTDSQEMSQLESLDGSILGAPPGMVQTRLPFANAGQRRDETESDDNSDEEIDATPPPSSKRIHII
ncbi:hypothetical protein LPJ66_003504 [Kickxella alabastrina]|uniref:Uncharacterized protein n=1 Tax=Kickxella alabastrina TaxID=61397 RepID=A0ACC1IL93_9FUNG|nr:hypothetical protein LPJ66_003504 [Kickxella alabastrina]